jgi:uncharacterized protein (TIGR02449 family)
MAEFDLKKLEERVENLLAAYRRLQAANRTLNAEWQTVIKKNTELRHRLENVISRVRAIEQSAEEEQA